MQVFSLYNPVRALRIGKQRLDDLERHNLRPVVSVTGSARESRVWRKYRKYIDIVVTKPHPEPDAIGIDVFDKNAIHRDRSGRWAALDHGKIKTRLRMGRVLLATAGPIQVQTFRIRN